MLAAEVVLAVGVGDRRRHAARLNRLDHRRGEGGDGLGGGEVSGALAARRVAARTLPLERRGDVAVPGGALGGVTAGATSEEEGEGDEHGRSETGGPISVA